MLHANLTLQNGPEAAKFVSDADAQNARGQRGALGRVVTNADAQNAFQKLDAVASVGHVDTPPAVELRHAEEPESRPYVVAVADMLGSAVNDPISDVFGDVGE